MSGPSGATNPFTGTSYNSCDDVERDLRDNPGCKAKTMAIAKRIKEVLNRQQITELCGIWGCINQTEFWEKLNGISDAELKEYVDRVKGRKKKKLLEETAALQYAMAGVA